MIIFRGPGLAEDFAKKMAGFRGKIFEMHSDEPLEAGRGELYRFFLKNTIYDFNVQVIASSETSTNELEELKKMIGSARELARQSYGDSVPDTLEGFRNVIT